MALNNQPLLIEKRPVFCLALSGCYIILTGYRKKTDLERLLRLIHTMGGSVGKDVGKKVTHLIAVNSMGGEIPVRHNVLYPGTDRAVAARSMGK